MITEERPPPLIRYYKIYSGKLEALMTAALAKRPAARLALAVLRSLLERVLLLRRHAGHRHRACTGPAVWTLVASCLQDPTTGHRRQPPGPRGRDNPGLPVAASATGAGSGGVVPCSCLPGPDAREWARAEALLQRLRQQAAARVRSQGYAGLAAVALALGETQQALDFVAQAEALDPETAAGHVRRGHTLRNQGKLWAAKEACRTATDLPNALP